MSKDVDEKIVRMRFDNTDFEKNIDSTVTSLQSLKDSLNFSNVTSSIEKVKLKIPVLSTALDQTVRDMTKSLEAFSKNALSTFDPLTAMTTGFAEYETKIGSIQTILANTKSKGTTLDEVTTALDTLNTYADKTIYNFAEMTKNVGTFTAAGVGLQDSVDAIQGVANLAAVSGSNSEQAARAMFQLSQALASGKVGLQDWNSVLTAGMGGEMFQNALKKTAKHMGKAVNESLSFRESLNAKNNDIWLTSDVLLETLKQFSGVMTEADYAAQGYTVSETKNLMELGKTAMEAATVVKTFTQLLSTQKENMQSGWAKSWEYIIGDYETAQKMWTTVNDKLIAFLQPTIDKRNELLHYWSTGMTVEEAEEIADEQRNIFSILQKMKAGKMGKDKGKQDKAIKELGYDPAEIREYYEDYVSGALTSFSQIELHANEVIERASATWTGRQYIIEGLANVFKRLEDIVNAVKAGFREIFPQKTGEELKEMSRGFWMLTNTLNGLLSGNTLIAIKDSSKILFSTLSIGIKIVKGIGEAIKTAVSIIVGNDLTKSLLAVTPSIGNALEAFDNLIEESGIINSVLIKIGEVVGKFGKVVIETMTKIYNYFSENIPSIDISGVLSTIGDTLADAYDNVVSKVKEIFAESSNSISESAEKTTSPIEKVTEVLGNYGQKLDDTVSKSVEPASEKTENVFENFGDKVSSTWDKVKGVFSNVTEQLGIFFNEVWENTKEFFGGEGFKKVLHFMQQSGIIAIIFEVSKVMRSVSKLVDSFTKGTKGIGHACADIGDAIKKFSKTIDKTLKRRDRQQTILDFALAILALTAAFVVLAAVPEDSVTQAGVILSAMVGGLLAAVHLINGEEMAVTGQQIAAFGISILLLVAAFKLLTTIPMDNINHAIGIFGAMVLGLTGCIGELMREAGQFSVMGDEKHQGNASLYGVASALIAIGVAINLLVLPIMLLSLLPIDKLRKGLVSVGILILVLAVAIKGMMLTISKADGGSIFSNEVKGVASALIALGAAVLMLMVPVLVFSMIPWKALIPGLAIVAVMILGLVVAIKFLSGKDALKASVGILALAVAVNLLLIPILALTGAMLLFDGVIGSFFMVIGMIAALGLAVFLVSKYVDKGNVIPIVVAIAAITLAIGMINNSIQKLMGFDTVKLAVAMAGVCLMMLAMGKALSNLAIAAVVFDKTSNFVAIIAAILVMGLAISLMTVSLIPLMDADWTTLLVGMAGISLMMLAMGKSLSMMAKAADSFNDIKDFVAIIAAMALLGIAIALVTVALSTIVDVDVESLIVGFVGVAVLMIGLAVAVKELAKATKGIKLEDMATLAVALGAIVAAMALMVFLVILPLSQLNWKEFGVAMLSFVIVLGSMVGAMALMTLITNKMNDSAVPKLGAFAKVLTAVGIAGVGIAAVILAIVYAIMMLNSIKLQPTFLITLATVGQGIILLITQALTAIFTLFIGFIPILVMTILNVVDLILNGLNERLGSICETIFNILSIVFTGICQFIQDNVGMFVETVLVVVVAILEGLERHMQEITEALIGIIVAMINGVANKLDDIIESVINFIQKLADSLEKRKTEIAKAITDFLMSLLDVVLSTVFGKNGIMKKLPDIGKKILAGVISGLIDAFNSATSFLGELLDTLVNTVIKWINNFAGTNIGEKSWGSDIAAKIHIDTPGWVSETLDGLATGGVIKNRSDRSTDHIVGEAGPELLSTRMGKTQVTPLTHQNTRSVLDGYVYKMDHRLADISGSLDSINSGFGNYMSGSGPFGYDDSGLLTRMDTMEKTMNGLGNKIEGMAVFIDGQALVGHISKPMDKALGKIAQRKVR